MADKAKSIQYSCGTRESAWVTARPLQEYRASIDSQTSGGNRRLAISLLVESICQKQEAHTIPKVGVG
ncbi:MAG: hypothetical protein QNJ70_03860 [Xenococcaceae cyanobacterium MO_207.B15]|nr:hypothetical protein [Xenococcaceae cyanobacterium MO_207.B15]MDJ0744111.1 hypothetical protein [Xenococcaceae cyanobacterium MO_167.B27]